MVYPVPFQENHAEIVGSILPYGDKLHTRTEIELYEDTPTSTS